MSERAQSCVAVALLLSALSVTSAQAFDGASLAASRVGSGTAVLLALGVYLVVDLALTAFA